MSGLYARLADKALYHVLRSGSAKPEVIFTTRSEVEAEEVRSELAAARPEGDGADYEVDISWVGDRLMVGLEHEDLEKARA